MPTPSPIPPPERRHALIVEDDLITGLDLQAMLQPLGYDSFAFASTSDQALEQARIRSPDLTTVDVGLLDGDGFLAARGLRDLYGALPTVFITGDPQSVKDADPARVVLASRSPRSTSAAPWARRNGPAPCARRVGARGATRGAPRRL